MQRTNKAENKGLARLFFAIPLDDTARQQIGNYIDLARTILKKVRWIPLENLHITVRFIGNCTEEKIVDIKEKAHAVFETTANAKNSTLGLQKVEAEKTILPFSLQLTEITIFPSARHPRVLSLMIQPSLPLFQLVAKIEESVIDAGFAAEKHPYLPHLSIARLNEYSKVDLTSLPLFSPIMIQVDHLALLNSRQQNDRPVYEIVEKFYISTN